MMWDEVRIQAIRADVERASMRNSGLLMNSGDVAYLLDVIDALQAKLDMLATACEQWCGEPSYLPRRVQAALAAAGRAAFQQGETPT